MSWRKKSSVEKNEVGETQKAREKDVDSDSSDNKYASSSSGELCR